LRHGGPAGPPIVEATTEDPDAALIARWSIEANLDAGMADPYDDGLRRPPSPYSPHAGAYLPACNRA